MQGALNPFQPNTAFHIKTSHLICTANQMTGFYMKCNTGLKWLNVTKLQAKSLLKNQLHL